MSFNLSEHEKNSPVATIFENILKKFFFNSPQIGKLPFSIAIFQVRSVVLEADFHQALYRRVSKYDHLIAIGMKHGTFCKYRLRDFSASSKTFFISQAIDAMLLMKKMKTISHADCFDALAEQELGLLVGLLAGVCKARKIGCTPIEENLYWNSTDFTRLSPGSGLVHLIALD